MTRDEIFKILNWNPVIASLTGEDLIVRIEAVAAEAARQERIKLQTEIAQWKNAAATAEKWRGIALSQDGDGRTVQQVQEEAARQEREACAQVCQERTEKCEREAQIAGAAHEHDEAISLRATAWQLTICAKRIRARSQQ